MVLGDPGAGGEMGDQEVLEVMPCEVLMPRRLVMWWLTFGEMLMSFMWMVLVRSLHS